MERNIMGGPGTCRQAGTRPNFAALARKYGMDRRIVSRYWKGGGQIEDRRSDRPSGFDQVRGVIEERAKLPGVTKRGIHEYLLDRHADKGLPGHDDLVHRMDGRGMACGLPDEGPEPHPRYETAPGARLQFDREGGISMHDRGGREWRLGVLSATLGASRPHRFVYVRTLTTDDLPGCLLTVRGGTGAGPPRRSATT